MTLSTLPKGAELVDSVEQFVRDYNASTAAAPLISVHRLSVTDRHARGYELVVRQDPVTASILSYRLRRAQAA